MRNSREEPLKGVGTSSRGLVCWLVCWLVGWLVGWFVGWFVGLLVGWFVGLFICLFNRRARRGIQFIF